MPEVWDLADMRVDEVARLFAASGAQWTEPAQPADARRSPVRRLSVTDPTV
jgi:diacylglycerol O-acyltransferase / wax synthase